MAQRGSKQLSALSRYHFASCPDLRVPYGSRSGRAVCVAREVGRKSVHEAPVMPSDDEACRGLRAAVRRGRCIMVASV
jgi:hypothetical protein